MKVITGERERGLALLDQLRLGLGSSRWHIITADRGYLRRRGITHSLLAPFVFGVGGLFAFSSIKEWVTLAELNWFNIFIAVMILLTGGSMLTDAISYFRQAAHVGEQQMVFMPDGVVEYGVIRTRVRMDRVVFYDQVAKIQLKTWITGGRYRRQHVGIFFHLHDGTNFDWESDSRFGSQEEIAAMVLAAFAQYQARYSAG